MDFRIRPSSKRSNQEGERSFIDYPLKLFQEKQGSSSKQFGSKMQDLEKTQMTFQQMWRRQRQINHSSMIEIQKRLDMLEYASYSHEKDIKQALDIKQITKQVPTNDTFLGKNDLNLIKQALSQQRQSQQDSSMHYQSMFEQISIRQVKLQNEIRQLVNQQKNEHNNMIRNQNQQIRSVQQLKQKKIEQQYEMMKNMISNSQNRIYEELERKIRNESIVKEYVQDQIGQLKNEIATQIKSLLNTQAKFLRESKQSVESLFSIIQNVKAEITEELSETQRLSATNIKRVSMSIDMVKENLTQSINSTLQSQEQLEEDIQEFKSYVTNKLQENSKTIMEFQENKIDLEKSRVSKTPSTSGNESEKFKQLQNEVAQWKGMTEQKNLNVFKEISNTLKSLKVQWTKENNQINTQLQTLKQTVNSIKKSVPAQIKKSVQTIITIFNNQFDVLTEQLDLMSEMMALSKKQTEKTVKEEFKRYKNETIQQVKAIIDQRLKQMTLITQRQISKSQGNMKDQLERQSKYLLDIIGQKYSGIESQMTKLSTTSKKNTQNTTNQLQDFTLKMKSFNQNYKDYLQQQRKEDLKKRIETEQTMRKNASNLMDVCYKKCQFLVEGMKKAIQMNQMKDKVDYSHKIEALNDQFKKKVFTIENDLKDQLKGSVQRINKLQKQLKQQMAKQLQKEAANSLKRQEQAKLQRQKLTKQNQQKSLELKGQIENLTNKMKEKQEEVDEQIKRSSSDNKNLKIQLNNLKLQIEENKNQLEQKIKQLEDNDSEQTKQAISSFRQSLWKIEATLFSEQAKNKAVMDRIGEDVGELATNVQALANELKQP